MKKNERIQETNYYLTKLDIPIEDVVAFFEKSPQNFLRLLFNQPIDVITSAKNHKYIIKDDVQLLLVSNSYMSGYSKFVLGKQEFCDTNIKELKNIDYIAANYERNITLYATFFGKDEFYRRFMLICLFGLNLRGYGYNSSAFLQAFAYLNEYHCSVDAIYDFIDQIVESYYITDYIQSDLVVEETNIASLAKNFSVHTEFVKEIMKSYSTFSVNKRYMLLRTLSFNMNEYGDILKGITDSSKLLNELICKIYHNNPQLTDELVELLASKTLAIRKNTFNVLKYVNPEQYKTDIEKACEIEKNAKLKEAMESFVNASEIVSSEVLSDTSSLVKSLTAGNSKRKVDFLYKNELPEVHFIDGGIADENYMRACLISQSSDQLKATRMLTDKLKKDELNAFSVQIFYNYLEDGAEAKKRWVIYFCSMFGGSDMVELLKSNIKTWAENSRGAIAGEATMALALNPTPIALMIVDAMSRKYKFKQVKNAAISALEFAAKELNITKEQLDDRIVPNMGFDESMKIVFDYGARKFDVYLNMALELEVFDENKKKLKNLPAVSKKDEEEIASASLKQFKDLKKQLKLTVSTQRDRLELALSDGRKWTKESFENLFVKNPIMHNFAISLIWGIYENSELISTFRYMEDGTFNNEDEDELTLQDDAVIGIAHPIEMTKESIATWQEQLDDYEVVQSLVQLNREVYLATPEELESTDCKRFGGKIMSPSTLSNRLILQNFSRGEILDAGWFNYFEKSNVELGMMVELNFSGASVGYYDGEEAAKVYEIKFYSLNCTHSQWERIERNSYLKIRDVAPKLFSEVIYQIEKITSTSVQTDADWENDK